jgi:hypothetical protein
MIFSPGAKEWLLLTSVFGECVLMELIIGAVVHLCCPSADPAGETPQGRVRLIIPTLMAEASVVLAAIVFLPDLSLLHACLSFTRVKPPTMFPSVSAISLRVFLHHCSGRVANGQIAMAASSQPRASLRAKPFRKGWKVPANHRIGLGSGLELRMDWRSAMVSHSDSLGWHRAGVWKRSVIGAELSNPTGYGQEKPNTEAPTNFTRPRRHRQSQMDQHPASVGCDK